MRPRIFLRGQSRSVVSKQIGGLSDVTERAEKVIADILGQANLCKGEIDAIVVGSMLSPILQKQSQLATFIASRIGLRNIESITVDGVSASGALALRVGVLGILSGNFQNVLVLGSEQMITPDANNPAVLTEALAQASDWEREGSKGETFVSLNDSLMAAYIERYPIDPNDFYYISENAHTNAVTSETALLRKPISREKYANSPKLFNSDFVRLLDACSTCNGLAGILLSTQGSLGQNPIISGSSNRNDFIDVAQREDVLELAALRNSVNEVFSQAQLKHDDIDIYEVHDAYSIMSVLCLERAGFVPEGEALKFARNGEFGLRGRLPISTFGGLKARGHPVGASGVYQVCEIMDQLTGNGGENQVRRSGELPKHGLTSAFAGAASSVISHTISL